MSLKLCVIKFRVFSRAQCTLQLTRTVRTSIFFCLPKSYHINLTINSNVSPIAYYLEDQFVGSGVSGDGESGSKVLSQKFSLLDGGKERSVDFSLSLSS